MMFIIQIYGGGTETTATALKWAFLYMCLYPAVRRKVQAEIDKVIGKMKI